MNKWQFNKNSPAKPEEWSIVAPSFYDAPDIDPNFKQTGIVGCNSLKYVKYNEHIILNNGHYAFKNTYLSLFPSESISILINNTSTELPFAPSNAMLPVVESYSYIDGVCERKRYYQYAPGNSWSNNITHKWKFSISNLGVYQLILNTTPIIDQNVSLASIATLNTGEYIFALPEFPGCNFVKPNNVINWTIDNIRGLIMTDDTNSIVLDYDSTVLFTYIPKDYVNVYKIFTNTSITNEKFCVINTNLSARL